MNLTLIIAISLGLALLCVLLYFAFLGKTQERRLAAHWRTILRPPRLEDKVVVYVSAPLFNLSELIYSVGIEGISPEYHISLSDTLCNLSPPEMDLIRTYNDMAGCPRFGIAGEIAQADWFSYIPARDGFVLAKFMNALYAPESKAVLDANQTVASDVAGYLVKAIFAFDVFALSSLCNCCIFNSNGLQIDDGSAAEIGMIGERGMPAVYLRSQATEQFGPGASNPMPLGNANSLINQKATTIQGAIRLLRQKIANILAGRDEWFAGLNYDSEVAPPPLQLFWIEIGEAVFNVRYRSRLIPVDPNTGFQDYKAASTDFYYQNYYKDAQGNIAGSPAQLTAISVRIMRQIQAVERKWKPFMIMYGGCDASNQDFDKVLKYGCPY